MQEFCLITNMFFVRAWEQQICLLHVSHILQRALDGGCEVKLVQIDFSAAFDKLNHEGYYLSCDQLVWVALSFL